jgi:hypothetical protein
MNECSKFLKPEHTSEISKENSKEREIINKETNL